jgi:uncharacterized SAM-binding protein YcdF (DUF218 family)
MDTLFFIASKLVGILLTPDTWLAIALAGIFLALATRRTRTATRVSGLTLGIFLAIGFVPVGDFLLQSIERKYPPEPALSNIGGIIVLGGAEDPLGTDFWGQTQLNESAERFTGALALAKQYPEARVVFAGGSGNLKDLVRETTSEASVAERFFLEQGISPDRLMLESKSRNTAENARLSLVLADPKPQETWVLVTSAFHMPRAMQSFERAGWTGVIAWPVDYRTTRLQDRLGWNLGRNTYTLNIAIRETVGQLAYNLTGR